MTMPTTGFPPHLRELASTPADKAAHRRWVIFEQHETALKRYTACLAAVEGAKRTLESYERAARDAGESLRLARRELEDAITPEGGLPEPMYPLSGT